MLQFDALRSDTLGLFQALGDVGGLEDFVLIGGTAMALHHGHRESEDLDFAYVPRDPSQDRTKLPFKTTNGILDRLRDTGRKVVSGLNESQIEEAENEGFYLPDSHQDWMIDGVKLTFFAGDTADRKRPFYTLDTIESHGLRLLTSDAIFETKSRLLVSRATSRDLFDLWYFMDRGGKTLDEVVQFALAERPYYLEDHILRLFQPIKPAIFDPGFTPITEGSPHNFDELIAALSLLVDDYQRRVAAEVLNDEQATSKP